MPFASTAFSTKASIDVRSPKLLNVKFEEGTIGTPQLLEGVELPSSVTLMGQTVDLRPVQVVHRAGLFECMCAVGRSIMLAGVGWLGSVLFFACWQLLLPVACNACFLSG